MRVDTSRDDSDEEDRRAEEVLKVADRCPLDLNKAARRWQRALAKISWRNVASMYDPHTSCTSQKHVVHEDIGEDTLQYKSI